MLKKLIAKLNPFDAGRRVKSSTDEIVTILDPSPLHAHSFSCPCVQCCAITEHLTRARLKRQGA